MASHIIFNQQSWKINLSLGCIDSLRNMWGFADVCESSIGECLFVLGHAVGWNEYRDYQHIDG
jgi:hypothetical protein